MNWLFVIALFLFWMMLSASLEPIHLIVGALFAFLVVKINPQMKNTHGKLSLLSVIAFGPWLFLRVLKSGMHVCRVILDPKLPIEPELKEYKTNATTNLELTIIGNSITLTPGTITIEIEPGKMLVHSLDKESQGDILSGELDRKVAALIYKDKARKL